MPYLPMSANAVMLNRAELATVLNALRNRRYDGMVLATQAELDLERALRHIGVALGLERDGNGWWREPEVGRREGVGA